MSTYNFTVNDHFGHGEQTFVNDTERFKKTQKHLIILKNKEFKDRVI